MFLKYIGIFTVILSNWYMLSTTYNPPKDRELVDLFIAEFLLLTLIKRVPGR